MLRVEVGADILNLLGTIHQDHLNEMNVNCVGVSLWQGISVLLIIGFIKDIQMLINKSYTSICGNICLL